ncbi:MULTISPECIES: restriction endonuclease [Burkholderia]|uniref:Restriction endonuclease n=2 Tax=Burkholderia TaxID=32008 RepID=A0A6P2W088_9BURK|nr:MULTISPECIES: restriction endonuclease [Burkholderia]OXJ10208.1 hypothetical protein CFB45_24965 [Burkholderia sp. HI2500]VWC88883.1 restriction endonuclease [Burkholderia contaminans]
MDLLNGASVKVRTEIAVDEKTSTTEQGRLLEDLGREVLETQNHSVIQEIRLTGAEVDLLATHKNTGEKVFVECKAYRDKTISAEVLAKLLGNVDIQDVQAGWLMTTSELGKDAKGIIEKRQSRPPEERRRLQVYTSEQMAQLLIQSGRCVDPRAINLPQEYRYSEEVTLLISNVGRFWAIPIVHASAGIPQKVAYFHAEDGALVTDGKVLDSLAKVNSTFESLEVIRELTSKRLSKLVSSVDVIKDEFDNIVPVPMAVDWSDYRPARPVDFVGREMAQNDAMNFFDSVRRGTASSRLIAIKSPSGWGKSSFLNKLRERCRDKNKGSRFYLYPVDCRTAVSGRYAELALKKCFDSAIEDGFFEFDEPVTFGSSSGVFSEASIRRALEVLKSEQKIIILFFDQFEEVTTKVELEDLFGSVQSLSYAVDALAENVVLGFSWKTDGTVPQDHPAYHTWHNLADRRYEIELSPFSAAEVTNALNKFSKQLKNPINAQLKRMLSDHCQGYPWLLKKLCIHVFQVLVKGNAAQSDILNKALNVEELFKKDLSGLNANEHACLRRIALESPAEFFQIENTFDGDTVKRLIDKRLIIRNATKLILYWDIFRDYVLTERVPFIPIRYIPRTHVSSYKQALQALLEKRRITQSTLERRLKIGAGTADNVARDLVMIGNAERLRKEGKIELLQDGEAAVCGAIHRFLLNHEVLRRLVVVHGPGFKVSESQIAEIMKDVFLGSDFAEKTWLTYTKLFVRWLEAFKLISTSVDNVEHTPDIPIPKRLAEVVSQPRRSRSRIFIGEAPPQRVLDFISRLQKGETPSATDRNSLYVLRALNLIPAANVLSFIENPPRHGVEKWLASKVAVQPTITAVWRALDERPETSPVHLGEFVAVLRGSKLSDASKLRYGTSLQVWLRWAQQILG